MEKHLKHFSIDGSGNITLKAENPKTGEKFEDTLFTGKDLKDLMDNGTLTKLAIHHYFIRGYKVAGQSQQRSHGTLKNWNPEPYQSKSGFQATPETLAKKAQSLTPEERKALIAQLESME